MSQSIRHLGIVAALAIIYQWHYRQHYILPQNIRYHCPLLLGKPASVRGPDGSGVCKGGVRLPPTPGLLSSFCFVWPAYTHCGSVSVIQCCWPWYHVSTVYVENFCLIFGTFYFRPQACSHPSASSGRPTRSAVLSQLFSVAGIGSMLVLSMAKISVWFFSNSMCRRGNVCGWYHHRGGRSGSSTALQVLV